MNNENDKGFAFPYEVRNGAGEPVRDHYGLTTRQYFAGKALTGLLAAHPDTLRTISKLTGGTGSISEMAFKIADGMIKEGEK